ncbi:MAG: respiratory nitrate reductase subunit gamma [Desulfovibrio desulfuricans]|uniref:respiratory nitrate reductase subunit gamma n=1 Tax=Desulfovibrio sp. TaxID=885 RepID=UPI002A250F9F|nr:respiratory nitrate reductase subunit gamma [Pygmaiobacter sp.]MDD3684100.1 respiratory nitrate reductase subunit gamma [Desulfovibrio desulfuricans]
MNTFFYVIYPYVCLSIMACGLPLRYLYAPGQWNARSSQFFERRLLLWGSTMFHVGILLSLGGHVVGLLIPSSLFAKMGISHELHVRVAFVAGQAVAPLVLTGLGLLIYRRLCLPTLRCTTSAGDWLALALVCVAALTGGYQVFVAHVSAFDTVAPWVQSVLALSPQPELMREVPLFLQIHVINGFTLAAVLPFTRLVHIFSAPVTYPVAAPVLYRQRYEHL